MICPNCKQENELTWKRHLWTITERYTCDHCQAKFRVPRTFKYFLKCLSICLVLTFPVLLIADFTGASITVLRFILLSSAFAVTLGVILPMDRKFKNTKGRAVLVKK